VFGHRARRRDGEAGTLADRPDLEGDLVAAVEDSPPGRAQQGVEVRPEDLRAPRIDDRRRAELQAHGVHRGVPCPPPGEQHLADDRSGEQGCDGWAETAEDEPACVGQQVSEVAKRGLWVQ
jgi:hypothetical protein